MAGTPFAQDASTGPAAVQAAASHPPGWPTQPPQPVQPQPARKSPRLWPLALGAILLVIAAIAATAVITYALVRSAAPKASDAEPSVPVAANEQYSADEQAAAKQHLCAVFDASTRGQEGQGGLRIDGEPNSPLLLRKLTGIVAVESALTKAPDEIVNAARLYVDANLDQMNAALGHASVDDINTLTASANEATYALADACGLPR
ncbi:hypothetical protein [Mycolicibacterium septicum]|uniref:hypothetical protein n=1 Tax=Mycolicibacterium septicum TaxID=98668 RepID=UPI00235FDE47|nr:hypothetical protein [Mycolicibacterium septicum]